MKQDVTDSIGQLAARLGGDPHDALEAYFRPQVSALLAHASDDERQRPLRRLAEAIDTAPRSVEMADLLWLSELHADVYGLAGRPRIEPPVEPAQPMVKVWNGRR